MSIPKIIHYVWVGPNELTPLAKECIASWKKFLPEYELKLWNETNSPMDHRYVEHMYKQKKWAFVSDYIRFWVLRNEGGIYLDTDTEVLKSFDDLLEHKTFFGQTKDGITAAGIIGSESNQPVIDDILKIYNSDEGFSLARTSPRTITSVLKNGSYKTVKVFDYRYFNPCDDGESCTKEKLRLAYTQNHWAESWVRYRRLRKLARRAGLIQVLKKWYEPK